MAILVWHFGRQGMSHKDSGQAGLLFDAFAGGETLNSDASWRTRRHPAYGQTGEPHPNWRLPESNVKFDAQHDLGNWQAVEYDDGDWPHAIEFGQPPTPPWHELHPRETPQFRDSGLRDYQNHAELPAVSDGEPIRARLPYNAQITPFLHVTAPPGQLIDIRTDNYRGGSEFNVRAEYVTKDGEQSYESLGWMNGHEVIYAIPAGVKILSLKYRETGYDTDLAGAFACDEPRLNTLWQKAQRTVYLEMRDGFVDCPGRERAQWWGDITLSMQIAFYALDRRSDLLTRKAMLELSAWQKPDGTLFSPVPAGNWDKELPMQMLAAVGRFGFWEYYRHTGDRQTIARVYPAVKRYLQLWQLGEDGLVVQRTGGWTWGDWGENKDMPLLYNAWYYLALDGCAQMARLLGDQATVEKCEAEHRILFAAFHRTFWNGREYRSADYEGATDDRGQALAVVAGLASPRQYAAIAELLTQQYHASPYMEKYVLEALFLTGRTNQALDRMLERYGPMIDSPITTLWEGWGIGPQGYGGGSYNHAWSGGPLTLLSQYVAGVRPLTPAYESLEIVPQLGRLQHCRATVVSPRGDIEVAFRQDDHRFTGAVTVPPNATAHVELPYRPGRGLRINLAERPTEGLNAGQSISGAAVEAVGSDRIRIELAAGHHTLEVFDEPD